MDALLKPTGNTAALATLQDIQQYVTVNRFSLFGLAQGLGRSKNAAALHAQLEWLAKEGYLVKDSSTSAIYSCTQKGWRYSAPEEETEAAGFAITFASREAPQEPPSRERMQ